jgi:Protein of unknown function (DUF1488)
VRLVADRPHIVRRPTAMQKWEGLPLDVEWQGRLPKVFVAFEVIDNLGGHRGSTPDEAYLKTFDRHRGQILDATTLAIADLKNFDPSGRLYIRQKDLDRLKVGRWQQVAIDGAEDIRELNAKALMNKFASRFIEAGIPHDVKICRDHQDTERYVYYFSPKASELAKDLLNSFRASTCEALPNFASMRKLKL